MHASISQDKYAKEYKPEYKEEKYYGKEVREKWGAMIALGLSGWSRDALRSLPMNGGGLLT